MTNTLAMLVPDDWALLRRHASPATYQRGDVILEEGVRRRTLFIIREGTVRVEQSSQGQPITLAQLGFGEMFGEMSFVEDSVVSASIIADDRVVVDEIDGSALQSLLVSVPGFAVRFYHSLAVELSRRLRVTSRRLSQAGRDAAQPGRFHAPHTGNASSRQIPEALRAGVDGFQQTMHEVGRGLRSRSVTASEAQERVDTACDALIDLLNEWTASDPLLEMGWSDLLSFRDPENLEVGVGDHIFRAAFPYLMLGSTIARCYAKPRGFPEDHETTAMIYRNEPQGDDDLGEVVDRWFLQRPFCRARRAGRVHVQAALVAAARSWPAGEPVRFACMASGTAMEILDLLAMPAGAAVRATCVDTDDDALLAVARLASDRNPDDRLTLVRGNAVPDGNDDLSLRPQHAISSHGLLEYLTDDQAADFLDWSHAHLVDGGRVIMTSLDPANPDLPLMEHLLDWKVTARDTNAVRNVLARSRFGSDMKKVELVEVDGQVIAIATR